MGTDFPRAFLGTLIRSHPPHPLPAEHIHSFIVNHVSARLNERVWNLMAHHASHLLSILLSSASDMDFKKRLTELTVKPSFYVESMIPSPHLDGLYSMAVSSSQPSATSTSSLNVRSAVINFRRSASESSTTSMSSTFSAIHGSQVRRESSLRHWSASL